MPFQDVKFTSIQDGSNRFVNENVLDFEDNTGHLEAAEGDVPDVADIPVEQNELNNTTNFPENVADVAMHIDDLDSEESLPFVLTCYNDSNDDESDEQDEDDNNDGDYNNGNDDGAAQRLDHVEYEDIYTAD